MIHPINKSLIRKSLIILTILLYTQALLCIESDIMLISDPRILIIPIKENHDPFIDLRDQNSIAFGPSPEIPNNTDYTKVRQSVYQKLLEAQKLLPSNLKFCLYEGYRSLQLQEKIFNDRYSELKKKYAAWSYEELFIETTKFVSPVINLDGSRNIPPHGSGAAIDIYLINEKGEIVDMGINVGDWMKDLDGSLCQTSSTKISAQAKKYRIIMSDVLIKVGFVNYPTEYWHWSYGDRYWAYHTKASYAFFGC